MTSQNCRCYLAIFGVISFCCMPTAFATPSEQKAPPPVPGFDSQCKNLLDQYIEENQRTARKPEKLTTTWYLRVLDQSEEKWIESTRKVAQKYQTQADEYEKCERPSDELMAKKIEVGRLAALGKEMADQMDLQRRLRQHSVLIKTVTDRKFPCAENELKLQAKEFKATFAAIKIQDALVQYSQAKATVSQAERDAASQLLTRSSLWGDRAKTKELLNHKTVKAAMKKFPFTEEAARAALQKMATSPQGYLLLKDIKVTDPFNASTDSILKDLYRHYVAEIKTAETVGMVAQGDHPFPGYLRARMVEYSAPTFLPHRYFTVSDPSQYKLSSREAEEAEKKKMKEIAEDAALIQKGKYQCPKPVTLSQRIASKASSGLSWLKWGYGICSSAITGSWNLASSLSDYQAVLRACRWKPAKEGELPPPLKIDPEEKEPDSPSDIPQYHLNLNSPDHESKEVPTQHLHMAAPPPEGNPDSTLTPIVPKKKSSPGKIEKED